MFFENYNWIIESSLILNLALIYVYSCSNRFKSAYFVSIVFGLFNLTLVFFRYLDEDVLAFWLVRKWSSFKYHFFWHLETCYDDPLTNLFIVLTLLIGVLLMIWVYDANKPKNDILACIILTEFCLFNVFIAKNILMFFIFFEFSAVPLMYLIGRKGPTFRKIKALYYFIGYTLLGSSFFLTASFLLYLKYGTFNMDVYSSIHTYDITDHWIWICLFLAFSIKIPMMPFHLWLIEAHVEAPTVGSVILAALLLKIGGYGMLRFCVLATPALADFYSPLVISVGLASMFFSSLNAFTQADLKRAIAYSSIAHMNAAVVGLFSLTKLGVMGCIISMISHGFVSAALFLLAGFLYKAYHTKNLYYFSGLAQINPIFSAAFLFFCFANVAFPGTLNFVGEIFIVLGIFNASPTVGVIFVINAAILFIYFIWLIGRICFSEINVNYLQWGSELSKVQICVLTFLTLLTVYFGLLPNELFDPVWYQFGLVDH